MNTSPEWELIVAERKRQIEQEGFDADHDSRETPEALCQAALAYRECPAHQNSAPICWPWDLQWWKPKTRLRNLVRAGALYLAASDRAKELGRHSQAKNLKDMAIDCSHRITCEKLIQA